MESDNNNIRGGGRGRGSYGGRGRGRGNDRARSSRGRYSYDDLSSSSSSSYKSFHQKQEEEDEIKQGKLEEGTLSQLQQLGLSQERTLLQKLPPKRHFYKSDNDVTVAKRPQVQPLRVNARTIVLTTNHFKFSIKEQAIYQYAVEFKPEVDSIKLKHRLIDEQKDFFGPTYIFDGAMLFLLKKLSSPVSELVSLDKATGLKVTLTVELPPGIISIQLCNLMFRKNILRRLKLKLIGRNYFDPQRAVHIEKHRVQLWPGFLTSINTTDAGVMLVADVTHKVLRMDTVWDFIQDLQQKVPRIWKQKVEEQLRGMIVLTPYNNRTYRVDGIIWNMTPRSKFTKRTGEEFSYIEYYEKAYNRKIAYPDEQPLLIHKQKRKGNEEAIYLIPELCSMTGITEAMRSDNYVMKDISSHTRVSPNDRGAELEAFLKSINDNPEVTKDLQQWKMSIDSTMLKVDGKLFDNEKIFFKTKSMAANDNSEWSNMCKNSELLYSIPLQSWLLVYPLRIGRETAEFSQNLAKVAAGVGFQISKPRYVELLDDKKTSYVEAIKQNISEDTQCVVCVLPNNSKDRYDAVKQLCCLDVPVPSQCVVMKSIKTSRNLLSICNKIALQMNCKLGGELWRLDIPLGKTMLVGVDVYHDTITKGLSVAGFCASYNANFTKYHSFGVFQKGGQELVDGLKMCMLAALRKFFEANRFLPDMILVFRDGVGDGMLEGVVEHEIPQMIQTFKEFGDTYKPRLSVVVVKKRIHARFFEKKGNFLQNPPPGTVVDSGCVHKDWYDFFLVSQSVKQGKSIKKLWFI